MLKSQDACVQDFAGCQCFHNVKIVKKSSEKIEALLRLNIYIIILLILRVNGHKMVKGENTESESAVQSLISKVYFSTPVYFSLSLLNQLSYPREEGTATGGWWE